jgi:spore germination cell wall hydrolase CwlJ-like protein
MTGITLDKGEPQAQTELPSNVSVVAKFLFMILALTMSVSLLKWAVADKLARYELAESSQITVAVRERQLGCLAKNIYYEAGSEPFEGKVAVAQVTMNRVESGQFPDDVCRTIYQKNVIYEKVVCQFSWACDRDSGTRPPNNGNYKESMEVAKKVLLEEFRLPALKEAMYYHADYINPGWRREKVAKIGHHIFYK